MTDSLEPTPPEGGPTGRRRRTLFWFVAAAVFVLTADLVTKWVVNQSLPQNGPHVQVFGEFFRLRHIRNSGGLFGLFPGNALYFAAVSIVAVVVILWVLIRSRERSPVQQIALGLVLGGALGNLHDRIRYHEVVDFLDVGIGTHRWPTFNVADSGVTIGVTCLIVWLYVSERRREKEAAEYVDDAAGPDATAADRCSGA